MIDRYSRTFEAFLGALVLFAALAFFCFVYIKTDTPVLDGYELKARFDRVDGLLVGSDVRISGVKVGKVRDIHLDHKNYLAVVLFDVSPTLKVPQDSMAQITSDGLLGGKFLSIAPGTEQGTLKPGDEITQTQSALNIESLVSQFVFNSKSSTRS